MQFQCGEPTLEQALNRHPWNSAVTGTPRMANLMQMWYVIGSLPHQAPSFHSHAPRLGHCCDPSAGLWLSPTEGWATHIHGLSSSDTHSFPSFNALSPWHPPVSQPVWARASIYPNICHMSPSGRCSYAQETQAANQLIVNGKGTHTNIPAIRFIRQNLIVISGSPVLHFTVCISLWWGKAHDGAEETSDVQSNKMFEQNFILIHPVIAESS